MLRLASLIVEVIVMDPPAVTFSEDCEVFLQLTLGSLVGPEMLTAPRKTEADCGGLQVHRSP